MGALAQAVVERGRSWLDGGSGGMSRNNLRNLSRREVSIVLVRAALKILLVANISWSCCAYTYVQSGVDSNFLIDDKRLIFAQADGSLTVLALDNGQVLRREKSRHF